ncbi:MAG: Ig-like domain-containing protein, partial [Verrucomicrobia bacterium]|nr:Ig-like domain-containing protein [Verrucomicrobiota bacterium]
YSFQYVGTANVNPGRLPTTPIDQTWHDSGTTETWRTLAVREFIGSWLTTLAASEKTPAIIAMMTGTNDIRDNNAPASVSNVSAIIDTVHTRTPATKLFVAKIVPVFSPDNAWVAAYNAGLATLVGEKQALGYNVAIVDLYTGFPFATGMTADTVHPNAAGYEWLAQQWHTALTTPVTTLNSNGNAFAGSGWDHGLPAPGTDGVIGGNGTCGAFDISTPFDFAKDGVAVTVAHTAGAITSGGGPGDWAAKNSSSAFYYWCQSGGSLSVPRSIAMGDHLHYTLSNAGTLGATQQTGGFVGPVGGGTFTQTGGTVTNLGYRVGNGSTLSLSGGAGSNIGRARGSAYGLANNASARIDISGNYAATIDPSISAAKVVGFDSAGTGGFVLETTWTGSLTRDNFTKADWITALAKPGVMVGTTQLTPGNFNTLLVVRNAGVPGSRVTVAGPPPPVTVTWGAARNITGDSDVLTTGTLVYAYAFGNAAATVNTVPFALGNVSGGGTDVTFGYIDPAKAYSGPHFGPDAGLSAAYNTLLTGANWAYKAFPLTLNHLTPGTKYTVQVWSNSNHVNTSASDHTSLDGGLHLLGKMAANGNRGQYATGTFTASKTSQVIAVGGTPQELINAIQVRTAPDPGIPTISITNPADGATVAAGTDITITAAAADDGTITRVSFYDGATPLGSDDTTAPYTYVWSGATAGDHVLTAKVWDNTGLSATSAAVKVTVTTTTPAPAGAASARGKETPNPAFLNLETRSRVESPAGSGHYDVATKNVSWDPQQTMIVVIDMWDNHHCKGAAQRVTEMAPVMNEMLKAARAKGVLIVHSPSDCMDFYKGTAQRKRAESAPAVPAPSPITVQRRDPRIEPTYPDELTRDGDLEGQGACSGCEPRCLQRVRNWTRQIAAIEIAEPDAITDNGQELYNLLRQRAIRHVIVMGVHTNICVLGRPFGIRQLKCLDMDQVLCRDLTDSFHEPKTPTANHFRGNALIIEHIEKYLCPTITSTALTGKAPFRFAGDVAPEVSPGQTPAPTAAGVPAAHWSFDEPEAKTAIERVTGRKDPLGGNFRRLAGASGSGLKCDGFSTRLVVPLAEAPKLTGPLSIEAWFAPQAFPWAWCAIAAQQADTPAGYSLRIDPEGHLGLMVAVDGKWQNCQSEAKLPLMQWSHVAATFDPARGIALYINGKPAGQLALAGTLTTATTDLWIARNRKREPCLFESEGVPVYCSLDGILDEVKIHKACLSGAEIEQSFTANKPADAPALVARRLPSGPENSGKFGAFYTPLKFCEEWDAQWRGDGPDVVVAFDHAAFRMVCWRGISYAPCFVTEKGNWMSNEFVERKWDTGTGCFESMSDKQARFSHVKILENSDARAVVFWRNSPVGVNYQQKYVNEETGWGDWSEETYTVYPDGVAVRKVVLWSGNLTEWHEWCQSLQILHPGQRPEDVLDARRIMSVANMAGERKTFGWDSGPGGMFYPTLPGANIQVTYLNSKFNPFLVLDDRDGVNDHGGRGPDIFRHGGAWSKYSAFPWRNHWPVTQVPIIGRYAVAPDHTSQTYTATQYSAPYELTDHHMTKIMLCGLTDKDAGDLLPLARSWLHAPQAKLVGESFHNDGYDPTQRAYVFRCKDFGHPTRLEIELDANAQSPLNNLCLVVANWGTADARLELDGQAIARGKGVRMGHRETLESTDLIVWIERQAVGKLRLALAPADGLSSGNAGSK